MSNTQDLEWPKYRELAEGGQIDTMLALLSEISDDAARVAMSRSIIRHLSFDEWNNRDLDVMIAIADYAISDCLALGGEYIQQANMTSFNMSANLCDCWADGFSRSPKHFEKGLEYARQSLALREQLGRGPSAKAKATWAIGKHQHSLGHVSEAIESFRTCLGFEIDASVESGKPVEVVFGADDGYLMAVAYVALFEGDRPTLESVRAVLDRMAKEEGEAKIDAEIIDSQLREVAKQVDASLWPG